MAEENEHALVQAFLAWAKTKPADEEYSYMDNCGCAYAQFLIATDRAKAPNVGGSEWSDEEGDGRGIPIPRALVNSLVRFPDAFGALASRVEAALLAEPHQ